MNILSILGIVLICAYGTLILYALLTANRQIFPKIAISYEESDQLIKIPYLFEDSNEWVYGKLFINKSADHIILFHHGNGEDIGHTEDRAIQLQRMGFSVFIYDYPGYGLSSGKANEAIVFAASEAVMNYLKKHLGFHQEKIIHYGRSLGGGPGVHLAATQPSAGIILEGTFTSTFRVFTSIKILPWDIFDNQKLIGKIKSPILIVHGTEDKTVPFWHAEKLYELANEPKSKLWIKGGGHNNLTDDFHQIYTEGIITFYKQFILKNNNENTYGSNYNR